MSLSNQKIVAAHPWLVFLSASILLLMTNIDFTAANLALAPLAKDLHLNIVNVQWVITAYLLGAASLVLLGGSLGDIYGHKKLFLLGALLFILSSLGVGLSDTKWSLIIMRLFQGFGAALAWPTAIVLVREAFANRAHLSMGLLNAVMGVSLSLGPPVGGIILHYLNWRWIFFINMPLGFLTLVIAFFVLPQSKRPDHKKKLSIISVFSLVIGLLFFVFSLNESQELGIRSPVIIIPFFIGLFGLIFFIVWQRRIKNPVLDLSLFKNKTLSKSYIIRFIIQFFWSGLYFVLSLLFQNILGHSSIVTGLYFLTIALTLAFVSPFYGITGQFFSSRSLLIALCLVYFICFIGLSMVSTITPLFYIWVIMFLYGIGTGIGLPVLLNVSLAEAPPLKRGASSGILYEAMFLGGSFGAVVSGALINRLAPHYLFDQLRQLGLTYSESIKKILISAATGVHDVFELKEYVDDRQAELFIHLSQSSFYYSLKFIAFTFLLLNLVLLIFVWLMRCKK